MSNYDEIHGRARASLDPDVYAFFATGSGVEETLRANESAWQDWGFRPRVLRDVSSVDLSTTVLGTRIGAPVAAAPMGFLQLLHSDGKSAVAKGVAESGTLFALSTRSSVRFEEIVPSLGPWWYQVYVLRDRDLTADLVARAVEGGARALVLTVDTPYVAAKTRASDALSAVTSALVPALETREDDGTWQAPDVTPADIEWLRSASGLPVVVKGVLRGDDARIAVDAGASAVWVSNHGGRQLDGAVPTAHALPEVVAAVGSDVEVYVDGGLRTGRDVVRAVALGARAAFLGRPLAWALADGGVEGVVRFLDLLSDEIRETLELAGCASIDDVTPDLVTAVR